MALYHITCGRYEDYGTFCFLEAPEGFDSAIDSGLNAYAKACLEALQLADEEEEILESEFYEKFGKGPELLKTFSVLHPEYAAILSFGKKHALFNEAKKTEGNFISARNSRLIEAATHHQKKMDYVKENKKLSTHLSLESFLPAECKKVEVQTLHVRNLER